MYLYAQTPHALSQLAMHSLIINISLEVKMNGSKLDGAVPAGVGSTGGTFFCRKTRASSWRTRLNVQDARFLRLAVFFFSKSHKAKISASPISAASLWNKNPADRRYL